MASEVVLLRHLLLFALLASIGASKLNVARVLLPVFDELSTNFTLQSTDDNCLTWSTTREDIVKLTPIDDVPEMGCSSSVLISTNTKERHRVTADIFAEDPITRQIVRCVVIFDVIHSLAITTKTRELILEEAPEIFEVRAYDSQGNEFSTLSGVPMHWFISPLGAVSEMPVIKLTPFKDSSYGTPESLVDLEERGLWGDKVLLEGFKTGMSKVSVKLCQKEYDEVKSNEIVLSVIANLIVLPPEVYIMVGDVVQFKVIQTSYGKLEEIDLTACQYYLKIADSNIAQDDKSPGLVKGLALGETRIYLHDKNVAIAKDADMVLPLPSATIKVVQPAYMLLTLLPYKNWMTVVSERHEIIAEVFTEDGRKLSIGPDFNVHTSVGEAFHVQERAANGTWQTGWSENEGIALVTAILESSDPPLQSSGEITIFPRIILTPSEVILPWDPVAKPKYDIDLKATGGDGKYLWSSTNHSVGIVTQYGRAHTHNMGSFEVSAAMQRNHNIRETAKFHILPPIKLEIVEFVMESEIGTISFVHVALYVEKQGRNGQPNLQIPVTRCQDLNFKVRTTDPKFLYRKNSVIEAIGTACGNIAIYSSEPGTAKVTIGYQIGDTNLQDSVTLTFFKPLKLLKPCGVILLAVGSATNLIFTGGPRGRTGLQTVEIATTGDEFVDVKDVTAEHEMPADDEFTIVHALCRKLGESNVTMTISNPPMIPTCRNQEASTTVTVICGKPRKVEIQPEIKVADVNSCPMDLSSQRVVVQSDEEIDLLVKVLDGDGREFLNVSSLAFTFETKPAGKAEVGEPITVYESVGIVGSALYANKSYQKITPKIETGEIQFITSITGYNLDVLKMNKIEPEVPPFVDDEDCLGSCTPMNATITLLLVDDTVVTPDEISIYNHPSNKVQVDVKQGSGYYSISMTRDDIVNVHYFENSRKLDIMPIANGEVSIKLIDLCLVNKPAQINVNVVSIHSIRAEMSDKVELGKCITCSVSLLDSSGNVMEIPNLDLIELNNVMDIGIASVERLVTPQADLAGIAQLDFIISGVELGDTKIIFFIGDPDFEGYVASDPMDLQVFPSLKIQPRIMTLTVGAVMQYTCNGGPQPSSDMEFTADDDKTASICTHGVATGLIVGKTKVLAKAVGHTPRGQKIIYTEDQAELQVINLAGVKITTPVTRVKVGAMIPVWAGGRPEQITPMILATMKPSIMFAWSVQDAHIARIYDVIEKNKVTAPSPNLPFIRLMGLQSGRTMISLNATIVRNKKATIYTSTLEIDIVDALKLNEPMEIYENTIFMAPNSNTQLRTNAEDNDFDITYRIMSDSPPGTEIQYKSPATTNVLSVARCGSISTNTALGSAIIIASSIDDNGIKQGLMIPVEVKPVHYMMIALDSNWKLSSLGVYTVPLGSEFDIVISYFDSLGNKLIASGMETSLRASRSDLITIHRKGNYTFTISTKKQGITVLQASSDCNDKVMDFVKLNVTQVIQPFTNQLVVGDVICYYTPVTMDTPGKWCTSDASILQIDEATGVAIAVAPGKATIFHSYHTAAPLQISVSPIGMISVLTHNTTFTNTHEYVLPVVVHSAAIPRIDNLLSAYDCGAQFCCIEVPSPINCTLSFSNSAITPDMFETEARFDVKSGKHYCSIMPKPETVQKGHTLPKSDAYLSIVSKSCECGPQQVALNFVPGIQQPEDVNLDGGSFEGKLVIYGAPDALAELTVRPKDENMLWVGHRQQEGNVLTFSVQLLNTDVDYNKEQMVLEVEAESCDQQLTVGVKLEDTEMLGVCGKPDKSLLVVLHSNRFTLSVILGFILMITLCTYTYINYVQQPRPSINVNVMPPSSQSPYGGGQGMLDQSQRTPPSNQFDQSCYCTRSPEIRRNRRYL